MKDLELRRINMVPARLPQITEDKLRKKGQIESDESDHGGKFAGKFRIQTPGNFWPPIVKAAHERHHHSAHHDVMKMCDHEVGVMHVNIHCQRREK